MILIATSSRGGRGLEKQVAYGWLGSVGGVVEEIEYNSMTDFASIEIQAKIAFCYFKETYKKKKTPFRS